jgi:hypothetical protein
MIEGWAVKWRSGPNNVDHKSNEHLCLFDWKQRRGFQRGNYNVMFFATRKLAREFAKEWAYIARRPDLRRYPHDWRSPVVVRATLEVKECPKCLPLTKPTSRLS